MAIFFKSCFAMSVCALLAACGANSDNADAREKKAKPVAQKIVPPKAAPAKASGSIAKSASFNPCILSAAELSEAVGWQVAEGKPSTESWQQYSIADCKYDGVGDGSAVVINFNWLDPAYLEATKASMASFDAGYMEKIPSDPDDAYMQYQEGMNSAALHYVHLNMMVEIRTIKWRGSRADIKRKLLALKRIP